MAKQTPRQVKQQKTIKKVDRWSTDRLSSDDPDDLQQGVVYWLNDRGILDGDADEVYDRLLWMVEEAKAAMSGSVSTYDWAAGETGAQGNPASSTSTKNIKSKLLR